MRTPRVFVMMGAVAALLPACSGVGSSHLAATSSQPSTSASTAPTTTAPTTTTTAPVLAPLTGLPVPATTDLSRPALGVKIDNHGDAQPQVGLDVADVVYEERVEGITRFLAVFWSQDAEGVGPIRSARTSDINLLGSLGQPLLAWSGGNDGVRAAVADSDVVDVGVDAQSSLYYREPSRYAPHNLMSDTAQLVSSAAGRGSPPQAPFAINPSGPVPAGAISTPGIHVDLDGVVASWVYDAASSKWLRYERGGPHVVASGTQISASNVVVMSMEYWPSPADANSPEAQSVGGGSGVILLPNGTAAQITWQRDDGHQPFSLLDTAGSPVAVRPGNTWIELPRESHTTLMTADEATALKALR
ncbi:MAG: hypothetical protein QOJ19_4150 [Acidimicrobiia bacterium]|nr:hypothetical protein [Acidimicrobiia bacterium]